MRKIALFFILVFIISIYAGATVPGPAFEETISLRRARGPVISPDGKSIAFSVSTTDWNKNRYDSEVWLGA